MVAIPLEQGRFFNGGKAYFSAPWDCRNPFGAGTVFQSGVRIAQREECESQSLWSRDGFSIHKRIEYVPCADVAIPLEQGRFFNLLIYGLAIIVKSQSLWSRDGFSIARCVFLFCF